MVSKLSIATLGLFFGGIGQSVLYELLFPRLPQWIVMPVLFLPWLMVFIISFCNKAPFGARLFRYCLVFAMGWYGATALLSEVLQLFIHLPAVNHSSTIVARVLMYLGSLSFIVLLRACVVLRGFETKDSA